MVPGTCLATSGSGCARLSKIEENSLGTIVLVFFFLKNNLSFLLCDGVMYFFSNLVEHLTNLVQRYILSNYSEAGGGGKKPVPLEYFGEENLYLMDFSYFTHEKLAF